MQWAVRKLQKLNFVHVIYGLPPNGRKCSSNKFTLEGLGWVWRFRMGVRNYPTRCLHLYTTVQWSSEYYIEHKAPGASEAKFNGMQQAYVKSAGPHTPYEKSQARTGVSQLSTACAILDNVRLHTSTVRCRAVLGPYYNSEVSRLWQIASTFQYLVFWSGVVWTCIYS